MEESVPFQVTLDRQVHRRLQRLSRARGQSMGSIIRESLATYLAAVPPDDDPLFGIVGMFEDHGARPHGSVAEHHDVYLADAIEAEGLAPAKGSGSDEPGG
jgi:hypothetical protein